MSSQPSASISLKISSALLERLDKFAVDGHYSRSAAIVKCIEEYLDHVDNPEKYYPDNELEEKVKKISFMLMREDAEYKKEMRRNLAQSLVDDEDKQ